MPGGLPDAGDTLVQGLARAVAPTPPPPWQRDAAALTAELDPERPVVLPLAGLDRGQVAVHRGDGLLVLAPAEVGDALPQVGQGVARHPGPVAGDQPLQRAPVLAALEELGEVVE